MSVLLARASELCPRCVLLAHPFRGHECEFGLNKCDCGSLRVFIEMNDFCSKCLDNAQAIVVREPYPSEQRMVDMAQRKSPWLRRERRRRFIRGLKSDLKEPYIYLLFTVVCLVLALLWAFVAGLASWL
jgi:hypothetical protein